MNTAVANQAQFNVKFDSAFNKRDNILIVMRSNSSLAIHRIIAILFYISIFIFVIHHSNLLNKIYISINLQLYYLQLYYTI